MLKTVVVVLTVACAAAGSSGLGPLRPAQPTPTFQQLQSLDARNGANTILPGKVVQVCQLVSDATGHTDVADEFQTVIDNAWATFTALNFTLTTAGPENKVADLGGMVLDLCGGSYLLSKGLHFPAVAAGNLHMTNGQLLADAGVFPADDFVLHVDGLNVTNRQQRYRYVYLDALEINAAHAGAGCVRVDFSEEMLIHRMVCVGYTWRGVWSTGTVNELFIQRSWFHELIDYDQCHNDSAKTGVGIWLDNNDHQIDGVVVRCSREGIVVNGSASLIRATHIYTNSLLPASESSCIRVLREVNIVRIEAVYMDGCPIVSYGATFLHITGSMWLFGEGVANADVHGAGAALILTPPYHMAGLAGMQLNNNHIGGRPFNGSFVVLNETAEVLEFNHSDSYDTVIAENAITTFAQAAGVKMPATRFRKTVEITEPATEITLRFAAAELLLCGASHVAYTLLPANASLGFVRHALTGVEPPLLSTSAGRGMVASKACPPGSPRLTLTISAEEPIAGTIMVTIDQTQPSSAAPASHAGYPPQSWLR